MAMIFRRSIEHDHVIVDDAVDRRKGCCSRCRPKRWPSGLAARRETVDERVAKAVEITPRDQPAVCGCNLNTESEAPARGHSRLATSRLRGSDSDDADKERKLIDFSEGRIRTLVTKGVNLRLRA